ncbi:MAG TPA: DUF3606 domain-containing protein [Polyangiaceae bacterium]|jgi:hypothetical protein|nr:DUF3606 domain-containing protein [Polyangiaceae bacterium]
MPDDPNERRPADRERINIHEPHELRYWAAHFGGTPQQSIDCVKKVGVMVRDVKRCLGE